LLDDNDHAFVSGSVEQECALRTRDFVARGAVMPDHTRTPRTVDQITLYESTQYGDLDVMTFGSPASFRERSRAEYCEPDPEWAQVVKHVRLLRTDLQIDVEDRTRATYRARYVMQRPQVVSGEVDLEGPTLLYITDEVGAVVLKRGRPLISSTQTVTRIHWLAADEVPPDSPLPEFQ
jgi:hypothetical protein